VLLVYGPPASGQSHLLHAAGEAAARRLGVRPGCDCAADAAHRLVTAIRMNCNDVDRRARGGFPLWIVDDMHWLRAYSATAEGLARAVRACIDEGGRVACGGFPTAGHAKAFAESGRGIPSRSVGLAVPGREAMCRIVAGRAAGAKMNVPAHECDAIARRSGGDVRR